MPKSSRKQIDDDEKKILQELQRNSKESIDGIAKKCGFSRQKVWRIIKRLEKNKTIWGYRAVVDDERINMNTYFLLIKGRRLPIGNPAEKDIVERTMDKLGGGIGAIVEDSIWLHGEYDWILSFRAEDLKTAKRFYEIITQHYGENISELTLMETIVAVKKGGFDNPKIVDTKKLLE